MQNARKKYLNTSIYFNIKKKRVLGIPVCAMQELGMASTQSLCWSSSTTAKDSACEWQKVFLDGELEHPALSLNVSGPFAFCCAAGLWRSAANPWDSTAHGNVEEGLEISENHPGELLWQKRSTDEG